MNGIVADIKRRLVQSGDLCLFIPRQWLLALLRERDFEREVLSRVVAEHVRGLRGVAIPPEVLECAERALAGSGALGSWREAALLKVRTRRAIAGRVRAGEAAAAVARDYGVPEEFVAIIAQPGWDLLSGEPS